jgi:hypothetical protein
MIDALREIEQNNSLSFFESCRNYFQNHKHDTFSLEVNKDVKSGSPWFSGKKVIIYKVFPYFVVVHILSIHTGHPVFAESINYASLLDRDNNKSEPAYRLTRIN